MVHKTNRYKDPQKKAAYEQALKLAASSDLNITSWASIALDIIVQYKLSVISARQIASKAVRVERGRREKEKK